MLSKQPHYLILVFLVVLLVTALSRDAAPQPTPENEKQPAISLPEDVSTAIAEKAASVKTERRSQTGPARCSNGSLSAGIGIRSSICINGSLACRLKFPKL
jgi:hypothetical protein